MYLPIWVLCLLSALGGVVLTFLAIVAAVVINNKHDERGG